MAKRMSRGFYNSKAAKDTLLRLFSVSEGLDLQFPEKMLEEIRAISIEGANPDWQIGELQKILDKWANRH
jgi:hypothetical protein